MRSAWADPVKTASANAAAAAKYTLRLRLLMKDSFF